MEVYNKLNKKTAKDIEKEILKNISLFNDVEQLIEDYNDDVYNSYGTYKYHIKYFSTEVLTNATTEHLHGNNNYVLYIPGNSGTSNPDICIYKDKPIKVKVKELSWFDTDNGYSLTINEIIDTNDNDVIDYYKKNKSIWTPYCNYEINDVDMYIYGNDELKMTMDEIINEPISNDSLKFLFTDFTVYFQSVGSNFEKTVFDNYENIVKQENYPYNTNYSIGGTNNIENTDNDILNNVEDFLEFSKELIKVI